MPIPYPIQKEYSAIFGQIIIVKRVDPQSNEILLNLCMKCWNSAFNAQGSKVIIVVVQVRAVKIYVTAVQALKKKETQDETQFTTKSGGKN